MEKILYRTLMDKLAAALVFFTMLGLFVYSSDDYGLPGKTVWILFIAAVFINALFVLITPIAKIKDTRLFLYSEVQPVIYNVRPQVVNLNSLTKLKISKRLLEYRAIFSMSNGQIVIHGFPATKDKRVNRFLEFLRNNTDSEAIKQAYNKAFN